MKGRKIQRARYHRLSSPVRRYGGDTSGILLHAVEHIVKPLPQTLFPFLAGLFEFGVHQLLKNIEPYALRATVAFNRLTTFLGGKKHYHVLSHDPPNTVDF